MASNSKNLAELLNGDVTVTATDIADGSVTSAKLDTNIDVAGTLDVTGATTLDAGLTVDAGTLHVDNTNNRVGVGKLSPDTAFHVESTSQLPQAKVSYDSTRSVSFGHSSIIQTSGASQENPFSIHSRGFHSGTGNVIKFFTGGQSDGTGETEKLRILSTGGITFNGDTAAANALDDYEEGTFTPSFSSSFGIVTYTQQQGFYTKKGREVTCHFNLEWSARSNSGGSYGVTVNGFPFQTPSAATGRRNGGQISISGFENIPMGSGYYSRTHGGGYMNASSTQFYMRFSMLNGSEVSPDGSSSDYQSGGYYYGRATYWVS